MAVVSFVYFSDPQKYNNETGVIKLSPVCDKLMSLDLCDVSQYYYNSNRMLHVIAVHFGQFLYYNRIAVFMRC
jgi:hypothetical protein